jgi:nucleotide-binding universal stress UspA family protein
MLLFNKILCPTDFSEPSYQALKKAMTLASRCNAQLCLLHVVPLQTPTPGEDGFSLAQRHLEELIRDYAPAGLQVHAVVRKGDVTNAILRLAQNENFDLIVMATHGTTGWRDFVLGSVMDEVVRLAPCPVLTISSTAHQNAEAQPEAVSATHGDDSDAANRS